MWSLMCTFQAITAQEFFKLPTVLYTFHKQTNSKRGVVPGTRQAHYKVSIST
jgi:hypothetical protein